MSDGSVKYLLDEREIPTHWVNLMADLPGDGPPPLHPGTLQRGMVRDDLFSHDLPAGADPARRSPPSRRSRSPSPVA